LSSLTIYARRGISEASGPMKKTTTIGWALWQRSPCWKSFRGCQSSLADCLHPTVQQARCPTNHGCRSLARISADSAFVRDRLTDCRYGPTFHLRASVHFEGIAHSGRHARANGSRRSASPRAPSSPSNTCDGRHRSGRTRESAERKLQPQSADGVSGGACSTRHASRNARSGRLPGKATKATGGLGEQGFGGGGCMEAGSPSLMLVS
jgi:hypothetical protein